MDATEARNLVNSSLTALGYGSVKPLAVKALYRDNRAFAGVHFAFEGVSAIWLAGSDEVRFFDSAGKLIRTIGRGALRQQTRSAA